MTPGWAEVLAGLAAREAAARAGGGEARREEQRRAGKLTARERIEALLDRGSFVETNMLAEHQCRDFGMDERKFPGDGVVTGHGRIDGRWVCAYAEDATVLGGSTGRVHGTKIHTLLRRARESRVPVIGLHDSGGARIQEGMDNVYGMTGVLAEFSLNSGVVPQIVGIMGTCAGGAAYSAALADFIVQVEDTAQLFVTGPALADEVLGEKVTNEDLGGCAMHAHRSGVTHLVARDDRDAIALIRRLFAHLPQNNRERPAAHANGDPPDRVVPELLDIVPIDPDANYDMRDVVRAIVDGGEFLEIHAQFARNMVVGFARLGGRVAGIVANNPSVGNGYMDGDAAVKAARFVRTCDAFNVPLVTLVDAPGFLPGIAQEQGGLLRHGAKLLHAWTEATVPKVSCILRKMYGGVIPAMGVHEIGFDQVFAWPSAEMQMVRAEPAVKILFRKELAAAADPHALLQQKVREYRDLYLTPYHSAALAVVDAIIPPQETRARLVAALGLLDDKAVADRPWRKHSNLPL
ncbi:MAG: acyl-CoA carboxylase subunit beta [Burkholderiales bacterium]